METDEIKVIIKETVAELMRQGLIKDSYPLQLRVVEDRLKVYFRKAGTHSDIYKALTAISDDPYIDIIFLQYRDELTIERVAEVLDKDVSTIKRNKKRLIMKLYDILEG